MFGFLGITELAELLSESVSVVVTAWAMLVRYPAYKYPPPFRVAHAATRLRIESSGCRL